MRVMILWALNLKILGRQNKQIVSDMYVGTPLETFLLVCWGNEEKVLIFLW